ncbi:hypothetical protein [Streptomyces sp. NPDC003077]|uniref:hypothetical protein n=1 Tax=Streptomyces sp. NPDC003077 TaxID=3154443 RepID=UPI0033A6A75D
MCLRRGHEGGRASVDGVPPPFGQGYQGYQGTIQPSIRELKAGSPAHGLPGVVAGPAQLFGQRRRLPHGRYAVETTKAHADRVDGAPAKEFDDRVADTLGLQALLDSARWVRATLSPIIGSSTGASCDTSTSR